MSLLELVAFSSKLYIQESSFVLRFSKGKVVKSLLDAAGFEGMKIRGCFEVAVKSRNAPDSFKKLQITLYTKQANVLR